MVLLAGCVQSPSSDEEEQERFSTEEMGEEESVRTRTISYLERNGKRCFA